MKNHVRRKKKLIIEIKIARARLKGYQKFDNKSGEILKTLTQLTNLYSELFELVSKENNIRYSRFLVFSAKYPEGIVIPKSEYLKQLAGMSKSELIFHEAIRIS